MLVPCRGCRGSFLVEDVEDAHPQHELVTVIHTYTSGIYVYLYAHPQHEHWFAGPFLVEDVEAPSL
jgi:hypothetical protein